MRVPSKPSMEAVFCATFVSFLLVITLGSTGFFRLHSSRQSSSLTANGLQVFDAVLDLPESRQSLRQFRYAFVCGLQ